MRQPRAGGPPHTFLTVSLGSPKGAEKWPPLSLFSGSPHADVKRALGHRSGSVVAELSTCPLQYSQGTSTDSPPPEAAP